MDPLSTANNFVVYLLEHELLHYAKAKNWDIVSKKLKTNPEVNFEWSENGSESVFSMAVHDQRWDLVEEMIGLKPKVAYFLIKNGDFFIQMLESRPNFN